MGRKHSRFRTKEVLEAVSKNGLKLNKNKCIFNATNIKLLGHILTADGIYPDPEKVKAIFDMPIPVNKGASAPLHSLIVKNCIWDFTESHKLAFQNIKKLTTECPTLKITNQNNM